MVSPGFGFSGENVMFCCAKLDNVLIESSKQMIAFVSMVAGFKQYIIYFIRRAVKIYKWINNRVICFSG